MSRLILPLNMEKKKLYLNVDKVEENKKKLEKFLAAEKKLQSIDFANKVLFSNEVQSNNSIEGYYDDIEKIMNVVASSEGFKSKREEDKLRILNLYRGYKYIMEGKGINKETLKVLYNILSNGLLEETDLKNMGQYYREGPVYIYYSSNLAKAPIEKLDYSLIDKNMNYLFDFINKDFCCDCLTDEYIKSQIIHFYFVYIHPYFDINGRTSRTTSMWYLINNKAYPYVIFNRGIKINKQEYYKVIRDVTRYANITYFINYMMKTVLVELQKEHFIENVTELNGKLSEIEYQTLHYLLSMNGLITLSDFANMYNKHNKKKRPDAIYSEMIKPLIERNILVKKRETNSSFASGQRNFIMEFNKGYIDDSLYNIGELSIVKKKEKN